MQLCDRQSHSAENLNPEDQLRDEFVNQKFRAYLQTSLRMTRKAYVIKNMDYIQRTAFVEPEELTYLLDRQGTIPQEDFSDLYWAISQLNSAQEAVIRQYYLQGQTHSQIAQQRAVSRQAVEAMKLRGLHRLKEILEAL